MFERLPDWVSISLDWLRAIVLWAAGVALIASICVIIAYGVQAFIKRNDE